MIMAMWAEVFRTKLRNTYLVLRRPILQLWPRLQVNAPKGAISSFGSILVISQRRLGDTALEIPSLRLLRSRYPEAKLGVVAPAALQPLLRLACAPQLLIEYPGGWRSTRSACAAIRQARWDLCIDLTTDYHLRPAWLAAASRAPIRVGFENSGRERFFNLVIPKLDSEHMADRFRRPLEVLGITPGNRSTSLIVPNIAVTLPAARPGQQRVGLHPGAVHPTQRWPVDHFASLARKIVRAGNQCLVLGVDREKDLMDEIVLKSDRTAIPVLLSGNVLEFATILKNLDLLVCNNSGPLHLAGLLEVPTLSFMGPTVKERWWPRSAKASVLRRDRLPCIGCNLGYCRIRTHACMKEITPEIAFLEITKAMLKGSE